jgi:hypothetical protein
MSQQELSLSPLQAFSDAFSVPSPDAAMRVACRKLLKHCGVDRPPVPLKPLCEQLGIKVISKRSPGAATLRPTHKGLEVWTDLTSSNWRKERFIIAHEIAHVLLMSVLKQDRLIAALSHNPAIHNEVERICDLGAAEILMPTHFIGNAVREYGIAPGGLQSLYDLFLVSFRRLLFRIAEITPSSAMILWRKYARHSDEPVAMRVVTCYQQYSSDSHAPWLPKGSTIKHVSPDIVTRAAEDKQAYYIDDLKLHLNSKLKSCIGIASVPPDLRRRCSQLPLFKGLTIPDERRVSVDAILFVGIKSMSDGSQLWSRLKELSN